LKLVRYARQLWLGATSRSSSDYWERRYQIGMDSGSGSYGDQATFKAEVLNAFVREHDVRSVAEFGCGDGNQLLLAQYPRYLGLDVSKTAIEMCARRFAGDSSKSFLWYDSAHAVHLSNFISADLTLSLDVIYHLLEDDVYERYLRDVFSTAQRFVIVYSSNRPASRTAAHVRHHEFAADVAREFPQFELTEQRPNRHPDKSFAEFFFFRRRSADGQRG